jgi:hypothetical protein
MIAVVIHMGRTVTLTLKTQRGSKDGKIVRTTKPIRVMAWKGLENSQEENRSQA